MLSALALSAGASAALAQCPANWVLASAGVPTVPADPPVRQNHAAACADDDRVLIFGGYAATAGFYGDTWRWSGTTWSQMASSGPSARGNHAMAYDAYLGRVFLFGGYDGATALGDTWSWYSSTSTWTLLSPAASPPARFNHAMAYDYQRHVIVLTGGFSTSRFSDTWEWNGTTWTQRSGTSYGARSSHAMAYDFHRNKVVLFGGYNGARLADTWEFDAASGNWSQIAVSGPSPRQYLGMDYDFLQQVILLFGGQTGPGSTDRVQDLWAYNGTAWTQLGTTGPGIRDQLTATYDRQRRNFVVFGGYGGSGVVLGDTWTTGCGCYANCDGSTATPILTANDFQCFLIKYAAGDPYANCDGSTFSPLLNANDFLCFINEYAIGCH
jgi:hypothetical protein